MRLRSRLITKLVARLAVTFFSLLLHTCKVVFIVRDNAFRPYQPPAGQMHIFSIWHDSLILPVFGDRQPQMAALISQHQDGSYLAETMKLLGFKAVRGSTKRGGAPAARQMLEAADNYHLVLTPDGPRGPRRQLKNGIVFLASHTGRRILPVCFSCRSCWRLKGSWSDLVIPKPFTTVYMVSGESISIPPDLSREELQRHTDFVQSAMDRMQHEADRLADKQPDEANVSEWLRPAA